MTTPRFIQIHTLHTYTAALINRDDSGQAKRLPMGDAIRTRISSQCLKRHWRVADDAFSLSGLQVPMAKRSRGIMELIRDRIVEQGVPANLAQAAAEALRNGGLLDKGKKDKSGDEALRTGQAVLLGVAEIDYLVQRCSSIAGEHSSEKSLKLAVSQMLKAEEKNLNALKHGSGLESALFGRMVTSDVLADRDASIYVSHAFTVHKAQVENDYFTVVDDLLQAAGEMESAGIFDTELSSGLYYGYVVVDVRQLVENLEGIAARDCFSAPAEKRDLAARVVQHLLHLIATVSPGAKKGSTAPFDWAKLMLVEAGDWQPRSLAGAFHDALPLDSANGVSIRLRAVQRISQEIAAMDNAYGAPLTRRFMALDDVSIAAGKRTSLARLADWASDIVRQGTC